MRAQRRTGWAWRLDGHAVVLLLTAFLLAMAPAGMLAQASSAAAAPAPQGVLVDRVVAVVNGEPLLESDVEEERRFSAFQPIQANNQEYTRSRAVERLINRTLILQQIQLQPQAAVSAKEVDAQLAQLRTDIPACQAEHCNTDAGWERFVKEQGFTMPELRERWRQRMEVLRYIEQRFRAGIRIAPEEIDTYYTKTLLPEYAARKATPPKEAAISERIQEVLLQQQVSSLLQDWLRSLRAQGNVRVMTPGEAVMP